MPAHTAADRSLQWVEVTTNRNFQRWLALTDKHYPNGRYVPPSRQELMQVFRQSQRGACQRYCRFYALFDVRDRLVARTTVHCEPALDEKFGRKVQLFGFTEFIDDFAVFGRLMDEIESIAANRRCEILFGPANFLPNQAGGVITSNFERPSFLDAAYNPGYYPDFYERARFTRRFPSATYKCDLTRAQVDDADLLFPFDDHRIDREGLVIHRGDRRHLKEQLALLHRMLNGSFAELGYYTPLTLQELCRRSDGLNHLLDEDLLLYLTRFGEPVAFIVCVPDFSDFLVNVRGNMNLWNQVRLFLARKRFSFRATMIVKGTVPHAQNHGYMTLLARTLYRNLVAKGYLELRITFIERTNTASASQILRMGGGVLHDVTFYQRAVAA